MPTVAQKSIRRHVTPEDLEVLLRVPFELPANVERLDVTVRRSDRQAALRVGIFDPRGLRGFWCGDGESKFLARESASPGFDRGPLVPGAWNIGLLPSRIGTAGCDVDIELSFHEKHFRWLKGDLHLHTDHSDGRDSPAVVVDRCRDMGLDFIAITDHDSRTSHDYLPYRPGFTVLPGIELSSPRGHANCIGIDNPYTNGFFVTEEDVRAALGEARDKGCFISINHAFDWDVGCQWRWPWDMPFDALEIVNGPYRPTNARAMEWWQKLLCKGGQLAVVGGSDAHNCFELTLAGMPTTWVSVDENSRESIVAALKKGNSFLTMSPKGPFLQIAGYTPGETVRAKKGARAIFPVDVRCNPGSVVKIITRAGEAPDAHRASSPFGSQLVKTERDPMIRLRTGGFAGARYSSGHVVLDEGLRNGRLCTRYWSAAGQVVPEMHAEKVEWAVDEPADSFVVAVDGQDLAGGYEWVDAAEEADASGLRPAGTTVACAGIRLAHRPTDAEVTVHTRLDGSPFLVRWLEIRNTSPRPFSITAACPFGGMIWSRRIDEHLPPGGTGAGSASPFQLAYNHLFNWGQEGDFWFEPLNDGVKVINGGKLGRSGWGRPAFWAHDIINGQTLVCELAWGGNYEMSLDCRVREASNLAKLFFRMGLAGQDQALRVLRPGETVKTPAVHVGFFQADADTIVQATHAHLRSTVLPEPLPGRHVEIEANHMGYLCGRENEPDLLRDVEVAAEIGAEMYVIDAGWYGNDPNQWSDNTGDWRAGSWLPNGIEPIVAHARQLGMRFGLWVEIEAAGANSTLRKEHPEWLLTREGTPISDGRALDFSDPEVVRWAEAEVERIIRHYGLDMYRIDHNHLISPSGNRKFEGYTEDLTWRYYDGLFGMFERLRKKFPKVVFQNCAGGGGRLDWGTLGLFHNRELSDWMRMPRGLRILNGVTISLPPETLLRCFGTEAGEHDLDGDVDAQLRVACLCRPIFRGIAPSVEELTPFLKERIDHHLDLYKSFIRPVLVESRVYHHTAFLPLYSASPWCVLEYAARDGLRGIAGLFRTSSAGPEEFLLKPRGLHGDRSYRVTSDNAGDTFVVSGLELARDGIAVRLPNTMSSELLLFDAAGTP